MTNTVLAKEVEEEAAPGSGDRLIRKIRKETRHKYTAEDKIRIVIEEFRKEIPVSGLYRRENIHDAIYYKWLKEFMEAGKSRLKRDSLRDTTKDEVKGLRQEGGNIRTQNRVKKIDFRENKEV